MKRQKFKIRQRHRNFGGVSEEKRKKRWKDVECLENFKRDLEQTEEQGEVEITPEKIKKISRKMPNLKTPGPDFAEGFWLKSIKVFKKDLEETCKKAQKKERCRCG